MQVKICGLKNHDMMQVALDEDADYVGLVFFEKSPRNVSLQEAALLANMARGKAYIVALVVNASNSELTQIVETVQPDYLQLHGDETGERADEIAGLFGLPVIKAIGVKCLGDVAKADGYKTADIILFDAKADPNVSELPGGNGIAFDWHNLKGQKEQRNFMLSGGLTPENVQNAIYLTGCAIVDVSSGVEREKGVKDRDLIRQFIAAAKQKVQERTVNEMNQDSGTGQNSFMNGPDGRGHFGLYGGRFVAETLMPLILSLEDAYEVAKLDQSFIDELEYLRTYYAGRPSVLYHAERLTEHFGGAKIYLKRDELNHTGSHKINNCLGQILLAKRMGKTRIIAETGAGQHGVAVATVAARFNLPCTVFMGATDVERQKPNVFRMKLLGADIRPVTAGRGTLKDAMNEALRDWVTNVDDTFYIIGTAAGPHPYPAMVRDFQSVIGKEVKEQMVAAEGRLPDSLVACIGGGSNAIGLFHPFLDDKDVDIYGVEAAGRGLDGPDHAASLNGGAPGVLHGNRTYLLQDNDGQIIEGHSISAGLDYPGIGPEHAWLKDIGRVNYVAATDKEALEAFQLCSKLEGIIPALEPSHALAYVAKLAPSLPKEHLLVMNLCGRGDKDVFAVAEHLGVEI